MPEESTSVKDKVKHVLTEAKMILPGAQALLGFQFIVILTDSFDKLSKNMQVWHLVSLVLVALNIILLMTPAAYHRLVEAGESTEKFFKLASNFVIASAIPLALGICIDFFIVAQKVTKSSTISFISASLLLLIFYGWWFGYTLYRKARQAH